MGQRSSIARLDPAIRKEVDGAIAAGRTIDEIVGKLRELDADVSRSAVGRYAKGVRAAADIRGQAIALAKAWGVVPGGEDDQIGRLNIHMSQTLLMREQLQALQEDDGQPDWKQSNYRSSAVKNMSQAEKAKIEAEIAVTQHARTIRQAADAVDTAGRRAGADAATIDTIKREILGLKVG